jgi:hypothetical protein
MRGNTMNEMAQIRAARLDGVVSSNWLLPGLLVANTGALLALDAAGGIPAWVKTAVALFLAF